ncbi:MAG TPA: winged helix-turn-helix domain-containing protein [Thermoanaerobaculaceae bacterium]|nr:winged helix-turn-helix domain-containing protein [Thermoanaerobaculaceae bacterium]
MAYVDDIGTTAGAVWGVLVERGKMSLSALEKAVEAPRTVVYMAIGWLAREGKVTISREERSIQIWLT